MQALARLHPAGLGDDWADKLAGQGFFSRAQKATFEHYMQVRHARDSRTYTDALLTSTRPAKKSLYFCCIALHQLHESALGLLCTVASQQRSDRLQVLPCALYTLPFCGSMHMGDDAVTMTPGNPSCICLRFFYDAGGLDDNRTFKDETGPQL